MSNRFATDRRDFYYYGPHPRSPEMTTLPLEQFLPDLRELGELVHDDFFVRWDTDASPVVNDAKAFQIAPSVTRWGPYKTKVHVYALNEYGFIYVTLAFALAPQPHWFVCSDDRITPLAERWSGTPDRSYCVVRGRF